MVIVGQVEARLQAAAVSAAADKRALQGELDALQASHAALQAAFDDERKRVEELVARLADHQAAAVAREQEQVLSGGVAVIVL